MQKVSKRVEEIVEKANESQLDKDDLLYIFQTEPFSLDRAVLRWAAEDMTRAACDNTAEVYGQIGIDALPCSKDCLFCSFAVSNNTHDEEFMMDLPQILAYAEEYKEQGANVLTVMITADYDVERYLEILAALREHLGPEMPIMANMGDFDYDFAKRLREVGVGSIYHAVRMGEGTATNIPLEDRFATMRAAKEAGLKLSVSLESIGPEHDDDSIADMMIRLLELKPEQAGCCGRVNVENTRGENVPAYRPYQIDGYATAFRLYAGKSMRYGMGTYTWAEVGTNPRDHSLHTEVDGLALKKGTIAEMKEQRENAGFKTIEGPAPFWNEHA